MQAAANINDMIWQSYFVCFVCCFHYKVHFIAMSREKRLFLFLWKQLFLEIVVTFVCDHNEEKNHLTAKSCKSGFCVFDYRKKKAWDSDSLSQGSPWGLSKFLLKKHRIPFPLMIPIIISLNFPIITRQCQQFQNPRAIISLRFRVFLCH